VEEILLLDIEAKHAKEVKTMGDFAAHGWNVPLVPASFHIAHNGSTPQKNPIAEAKNVVGPALEIAKDELLQVFAL